MGNITFFRSIDESQQFFELMKELESKILELEKRISEKGQELLILRGTADVVQGDTMAIPIPISKKYSKYELKAVHADNLTNNDMIIVRIADSDDINGARYISLKTKTIDDIVAYPFHDMDETGFIHMWIENVGYGDIRVAYELRILSLN